MNTDTERPPPVAPAQRIEAIDHRYKRRRNLMLWGVLFLFATQSVMFYLIYQPRRVEGAFVNVSPLEALGPTELCPGDVLSYRFAIEAKSAAVVDIDSTVLRVDPPVTLIFESTRRAIFPYKMIIPVEQHWVIPLQFADPATGEKETWRQGDYLRLVAVTTPARSTQPTLSFLKFSIKQCSAGG